MQTNRHTYKDGVLVKLEVIEVADIEPTADAVLLEALKTKYPVSLQELAAAAQTLKGIL